MQRLLILPVLLCLALCTSFIANASVSVAAGEITYEWQSDSTYRFMFTLYRDCSGGPEPDSVQLCFHDPCDNTLSFSTYLMKLSGTTILKDCSEAKSQCDSPASTLPGFKQYTYTALATLPGRCNSWHIFTHVDYRNNMINLQSPTSKQYYAEARFNNTGSFITNSSPSFGNAPVHFAYTGNFSGYDCKATDVNGDSIVYETISPLTNVSSCSDTVASVAPYITTSPALNNFNNPFQSNSSYYLNTTYPATNTFACTPGTTGSQNVALKVKEYRRGVLIGYVTREVQVVVFTPPPNIGSYFKFTPAVLPNHICEGDTFDFDFDAIAYDSNARIVMEDNHIYRFPGATLTYTSQYSDSVHGHFHWVPTSSGKMSFIITAFDSTCRTPGVIVYNTQTTAFYVDARQKPLKDTTICLGDTAKYGLLYSGSWSVFSGTPNSINCTTCQFANMYPTATSQYTVYMSPAGACPAFHDTVQVNVNTNITHPSVTITASPDTNIAPLTTVTFIAHVVNCAHPAYQWYRNGVAIAGAVRDSFVLASLNNNDVITCKVNCGDACPRPSDTASNPITIHVSSGINTIKTPSPFSIYPNPNNGSFTIVGKVQTNNTTIELLDITGKQMYRKQIATGNGEINEQLQLDLRPGIYILKIDNQAMQLVISR
ncbi:MAG: T9SS type A sorting domain-containing protein [Bacteroidetes bacterium]|nr:T9SS type A sorting domain-containing protein [Bacteroidota bacterium]